MTWVDRLPMLAGWRLPASAWPDVWILLRLGQRRAKLAEVESLLWRWRLAAWTLSLRDEGACVNCGGVMPADPRAKTCTTACRKQVYRRRAADQPTAWEAQCTEARAVVADLQKQVQAAERAHRRLVSFGRWSGTVPPDLSKIDHLPPVPGPCGGCGTGVCHHTGETCLLASTGLGPEDME